MENQISIIISDLKNKLTLEGQNRIFSNNLELRPEDILKEYRQDQEEFTRCFIIDRVLFEFLKVILAGKNRKFKTPKGERKVDYAISSNNVNILIEAKPLNASDWKLKDESNSDSAVSQIKGVFLLAEVQRQYSFGIATDGFRWIFINNKREIIKEIDIRTDFEKIKSYLKIRKPIPSHKRDEISNTFYDKYNDILHGTREISEKECFVNSISNVDNEEDKEEIAQLTINRLIFIKFLHERGFIRSIKYDWDLFEFLKKLPTYELNAKLRELFFNVLNKPKKERSGLSDVDPHFYEIPYLNGSLFEKADVELSNPEYSIDAKILRYTIRFLDDFKFLDVEELKPNQEAIDPEILGYIFERAMNAIDRKGTGAYYTPKIITEYMAKNTIYPVIIQKTKNYLIKENDYRDEQLKHIKEIDDILNLPPIILDEILKNVIHKITICDPAVGSGAFLLACAQVLFELIMNINVKLNFKYVGLEPEIKKKIIYNLYGVDINSRAIEIARLRIWLWLVEAYLYDHIKPLPNLDCNICVGNSLIGFMDVSKFKKNHIHLDLLEESKEDIGHLIGEYETLKQEYKLSSGEDSKKLKKSFLEIKNKIKNYLDKNFYQLLKIKNFDIDKEKFKNLKIFHWGLEFDEIFSLEKPGEERGFDVIIGNPPYIRIESLDHKLADIYKSFYESVYQRCDIYVAFIETSYKKITNAGRIGLITANQYIVAEYGEKIRELLSSKYFLHKIIDFTHYSVFPGITIYNVIIIGGKVEQRKIKCIIFNSEESIEFMKTDGLTDEIKHKDINNFNIDSDILKNDTWILKDKRETKIIEKIKEKTSIKLGDISLIGSPLKTGRDSILYQKILKEEDNFYISIINDREIKLEKEVWKKILKPRQLNKWTYDEAQGIIFFPYEINKDKFSLIDEKSFNDRYSKTYQFLLEYKEILLNRIDSRKTWKEHGRPWYSLHRFGKPKNYFGKKILTQSVTKEPMYCLDIKDYLYPCGGVVGIVPFDEKDVFWILAYLNSPLIYFLLKSNAPVKRGGYISLDVGLLSEILIPSDNNFREKLTNLCKQIFNNFDDKEKIEKIIDSEIYNFFNLSEEEMEIIEKSC